MEWFNYCGLIIIIIILIPNIIYGIKHKEQEEGVIQNKVLNILEQTGRYGSMIFMIFNIPYLYFNFWFDNALIVYLCINGALLLIYIIGWITLWNKETLLKSLLLSITPSLIFVFSGLVLLNIPLIIVSCLFAIGHITISVGNHSLQEVETFQNS